MRAILFGIVLTFFSTLAYSSDSEAHPGLKLGRGLANATTGFLEIPKEMSIVAHKDGIIVGATWGLAVGVADAVGRSLSGAFDIATFFIPSRSFVHPVFVWERWETPTHFGH